MADEREPVRKVEITEQELRYLESPGYQRHSDADTLRAAASILRGRFRRTFAMRVVTRVLELLAGRLKERHDGLAHR